MKILHTYCMNYNLGDYALAYGMKNLLRKFLPVEFIGDTNIQGRYFNEYYINEVVNKRYDLLVIGGGGLIHGSHWPNGWFWLINQDLIKTIKIPFIVYGIGDNYFEGESIPDRAVKHLTETNKYAKFFSVRNDGSFERVTKELPFVPNEVPDPGFYTGLDENLILPRLVDGDYVIVQLANDKAEDRFGNIDIRKKFVEELRRAVKCIAQKYKVIFLPHVYDDVSLSKEVANGIENTDVVDFSYLAFDHAYLMISYYKYAKFVLAMRGHGQIVPISYNVPTIAMCNHPKHAGLMKKLGFDNYAIDIREKKFSDLIIGKISILEDPTSDYSNKLKECNRRMMEQTKNAFGIIRENVL